jgi:hypothetical protein
MKRIQIVCLYVLLFLSTNLFAQNNYLEDNSNWRINSQCAISSCTGQFGPCIIETDYTYFINGDTIVNSHIYKKLFIHGFVTHNWFSPSPVPSCCQGAYFFYDSINHVALLRDTLKKIYIIDSLGNPETLLYDFDLTIGDTIPLTYNNYDSTITVIAIDSISVFGLYRKRFELSNNANSQSLIEGIGHLRGFIEPLNIILECGFDLICYSISDSAYFPFTTNCNNNNQILDIDLLKFQVKLFPNPVDNNINISSESNHLFFSSYNIINAYGQSVLFKNALSTAEINIDVSKFIRGTYFLQLKTSVGETIHKLFVKN